MGGLSAQTDSIYVTVRGDTAIIRHTQTHRNCGSLFVMDVQMIDYHITVTEVDTGDYAWCMCYFDLFVTIGPLNPGTYTVDIFSTDSLYGVYWGSTTFTIDSGFLQDSVSVISQAQSGCYNLEWQEFVEERLSYFPMHVGDKWQYEGWEFYGDSTWSLGFFDTQIIGDTITPNGKKYFIFNQLPFYGPAFIRIDTTELMVYLYDEEVCPNNEWDFVNLSIVDSLYWDDCLTGHTEIIPDTIFFSALNNTFPSYRVEHPGFEQQDLISEGIGLMQISYAPGIGGTFYKVNGANIDGIQYGEFLSIDEEPIIPEKIILRRNYPNPFNPLTTIRYEIPEMTYVRLTILDLLGREIDVLVDEVEPPGFHQVRWDASFFASGIYFYRLTTIEEPPSGFRPFKGYHSVTKKLVVLK